MARIAGATKPPDQLAFRHEPCTPTQPATILSGEHSRGYIAKFSQDNHAHLTGDATLGCFKRYADIAHHGSLKEGFADEEETEKDHARSGSSDP